MRIFAAIVLLVSLAALAMVASTVDVTALLAPDQPGAQTSNPPVTRSPAIESGLGWLKVFAVVGGGTMLATMLAVGALIGVRMRARRARTIARYEIVPFRSDEANPE